MKKLIPFAALLLLSGALIYFAGCTEQKPCATKSGCSVTAGGCCNPKGDGTCCKKATPKCCGKEGKCCKMPAAPGSTTKTPEPAPAPAARPSCGSGCGGCGS